MLTLADTLLSTPINKAWFGIIGLTGGLAIAIISVIGGYITSALRTRAKELSRREIAAYVAEGSIAPDDAVKLLDAGRPAWERGEGAWSGADNAWGCKNAKVRVRVEKTA